MARASKEREVSREWISALVSKSGGGGILEMYSSSERVMGKMSGTGRTHGGEIDSEKSTEEIRSIRTSLKSAPVLLEVSSMRKGGIRMSLKCMGLRGFCVDPGAENAPCIICGIVKFRRKSSGVPLRMMGRRSQREGEKRLGWSWWVRLM